MPAGDAEPGPRPDGHVDRRGAAVTAPSRHEVVRRLAAAGCVAADEEADELLAAAPDAAALGAWVARRERGEPLAWITGIQRFGDGPIRLRPGVYVPRPQSEELACRAAAALAAAGGPAIDLCTGSGAVALHLLRAVPDAGVVATDVDADAVRCARANGVAVARADLGRPFAGERFGVVTAVPPYVPRAALPFLPADVVRYEPRRSLDGGEDGLEVVRRVVAEAARLLRRDGHLFLELGGEQGPPMVAALEGSGWRDVSTWADAEGDLRGLTARATARVSGVTSAG